MGVSGQVSINMNFLCFGQGLLAVFTGRGCGTTRDVNFFRPTYDPCIVCVRLVDPLCSFRSGGDTEVDVNDVSYSLEKVVEQRKVEDTWQVDSFGGVSAAPIGPPDEVQSFVYPRGTILIDVVLCIRPSCCALILVNQ